VICFFKKKELCLIEKDDIYRTFFFNFNKVAKISQQKMILFQLEINLLLTKIKEIHRHYEQINQCLNTLHQKRINRTEKNIQQNSQNIALINNDKTQRKKPLFLVKRNGVIKNETICNVPKILKEKVNFMGNEKNKNVKKKHIVLHKKNKLLRNRYFNSVTGQLYETNDINDLPDETSTFELEDDLFDERENKVKY